MIPATNLLSRREQIPRPASLFRRGVIRDRLAPAEETPIGEKENGRAAGITRRGALFAAIYPCAPACGENLLEELRF
jgi:hypothetical protein